MVRFTRSGLITMLVMIVSLSLAGGCASPEKADPETREAIPPSTPATSHTLAEADLARQMNEFGADLYGQLKSQEGNLFFSPYSVASALSIAYVGAHGQTATEMAHALRLQELQNTHPAFSALNAALTSSTHGYQIQVANALWIQKGIHIRPQYLETTREHYGAGLKQTDFQASPAQARDDINLWVEENTNGRIEDLIPAGGVTSLTRLILTNAIYFKGTWAKTFPEKNTRPLPFHLANGEEIEAPLMYQSLESSYAKVKDLQILQLPYEGGQMSLILLLPERLDGLPDLENQLSSDNLSKWIEALERQEVRVYLPRFKMTTLFSLNQPLQEMGMAQAFQPGQADFSGINGKRDLLIDSVVHKAFVEVNEEGTEAAAATGVVMRTTSVRPAESPVFRADRPFLFFVRHEKTGLILFLGRLSDPR